MSELALPGKGCAWVLPAAGNPEFKLKPYQLEGLNWLALLHSQDLNGILADEMGLGKTVQAIAFLAHLFESGYLGPFLIIVPSSTIDNWARELKKWCPILNVLIYYGSAAERYSLRFKYLSGEDYHVILSTYALCISQIQDRNFFRKLPLECLILDEGHMLKNMSSRRYSNLMKIRAKRRLLLTGTPIQNNLLELMSLLSFIMPNIFEKFIHSLKKTFSRKMKESGAYYKDQVTKAKKIMQPFILRRLKAEVLQQLKAKVEETVFFKMADLQLQLYSTTVKKSRRELAAVKKACAGKENELENSLSVITTLRKIAMHPLLLRHHYHDNLLKKMAREILRDPSYYDADSSIVYEDMAVMNDFELHSLCMKTMVLNRYSLPCEYLDKSAKFKYLVTKLKKLKDMGSRVLLFSQFTTMLDIVEAFLQSHGHTFLRLDGSTPVAERLSLIDKYNSDSKIFIFLLSTRAGGLGINLSSANVVILHDIDFNPYNDKQAEDRCHRMGQTRQVSIFRLICKDSIEEEILQCAKMKLKLEKDINFNQIPKADGLSSVEVASVLTGGLSLKDDRNL